MDKKIKCTTGTQHLALKGLQQLIIIRKNAHPDIPHNNNKIEFTNSGTSYCNINMCIC